MDSSGRIDKVADDLGVIGADASGPSRPSPDDRARIARAVRELIDIADLNVCEDCGGPNRRGIDKWCECGIRVR